jgi:hypothetical protein
MADIPTEADQIDAISPNVTFPEVLAAVVWLKVTNTVFKAELGITSAR